MNKYIIQKRIEKKTKRTNIKTNKFSFQMIEKDIFKHLPNTMLNYNFLFVRNLYGKDYLPKKNHRLVDEYNFTWKVNCIFDVVTMFSPFLRYFSELSMHCYLTVMASNGIHIFHIPVRSALIWRAMTNRMTHAFILCFVIWLFRKKHGKYGME